MSVPAISGDAGRCPRSPAPARPQERRGAAPRLRAHAARPAHQAARQEREPDGDEAVSAATGAYQRHAARHARRRHGRRPAASASPRPRRQGDRAVSAGALSAARRRARPRRARPPRPPARLGAPRCSTPSCARAQRSAARTSRPCSRCLTEIQAEMDAPRPLEQRARRAARPRRRAALGMPPHDVTLERLTTLMTAAEGAAARERSAELRGLLTEIAARARASTAPSCARSSPSSTTSSRRARPASPQARLRARPPQHGARRPRRRCRAATPGPAGA